MAAVHKVEQGDTLISIAHQHGFSDWRTVWEHPKNGNLRGLRPDPQLLLPGDEVNIPDKEPRWIPVRTNARHVFELQAPRSVLRLQVTDRFGAPLGGVDRRRYELVVNGETREGNLDRDGMLEEPIAPDTKDAVLTVWASERRVLEWHLDVGHLDPLDEETGLEGALIALGYLWTEDEPLDPLPVDRERCRPVRPEGQPIAAEDRKAIARALQVFQSEQGLPMTGEPDEATLARLKEALFPPILDRRARGEMEG